MNHSLSRKPIFSWEISKIYIYFGLIKQILEEKGITQIWQDEKIDESFSQTNAYVCNRRQPRIEWLYEIASLLDVETKNLLVNNQEIKK
jgi:hypothetical protein